MVPQILCEGKNDGIFLVELLKVKNPDIKYHHINNDLSKFASIFRNTRYWSSCSLIIHNDNGHDLISKFIPRIIRDFFMRDDKRKVLNFYILKDDDGEDTDKLICNYCERINDSLISKGFNEFNLDVVRRTNKITITSERDGRYKFCFQFIFVPVSFEENIRKKALEIYSDQISHPRRYAILSSDPHEALNILTNELDLDSKENLIGNSAKEFWFKEEEWFRQISSVFDQLNV